jgi:hypothetical protein
MSRRRIVFVDDSPGIGGKSKGENDIEEADEADEAEEADVELEEAEEYVGEEENSDSSDDEEAQPVDDEKSEEEEPDEDDFLGALENEDDVPVEEEEGATVEDFPAEIDEDDGGGGFEEEKKKKAPPKRKGKRKIFPFIPKKKRLAQAEDRPAPEYHDEGMDVREKGKELIAGLIGHDSAKEIKVAERAIYNATARQFQDRDDVEVTSLIFKKSYMENLRFSCVALSDPSRRKQVLDELKEGTNGWKSSQFSRARDLEKRAQDKLSNVGEAQENPDYPCPGCKGILSFKHKTQIRSGDEGASILLWCYNSDCKRHWRING